MGYRINPILVWTVNQYVIYFRANRNNIINKYHKPEKVRFLIFEASVSNDSSKNETKDKIPAIIIQMSSKSFIMI